MICLICQFIINKKFTSRKIASQTSFANVEIKHFKSLRFSSSLRPALTQIFRKLSDHLAVLPALQKPNKVDLTILIKCIQLANSGRYLIDKSRLPADRVSHASSALQVAASENGSRVARRREDYEHLQVFNRTMREAQALIQKNQYHECEMSPDAKDSRNFEKRLPNDDYNYALSPAAKRARQDGSLDPSQTFQNRTFNRKLKMRDTFSKIMPTYTHGQPTTYAPSATHALHFYPKKDDLGHRM